MRASLRSSLSVRALAFPFFTPPRTFIAARLERAGGHGLIDRSCHPHLRHCFATGGVRAMSSSSPAGPVTSSSLQTPENKMAGTQVHRAFVAFGSNLGDRIAMIERACREMESEGDIRIMRTSCLWETKAMYVEDQADFLNAACEIRTTLGPFELLDRLQSIENGLGRVKIIDKGPRNIDLDILLYDDEVISTDRLQVPHKLMLEREFVLRPLCEMIPDEVIPTSHVPLQDHLNQLTPADPPMTTIVPLSPTMPPLRPLDPKKKTHIMSIINLTPDSFSDGGLNYRESPSDSSSSLASSSLSASSSSSTELDSTLLDTLLTHIHHGATILDIGAQSTRPHSTRLSPTAELARLKPLFTLLQSPRCPPELKEQTCISLDTYLAPVAAAALDSGGTVHLINDISAGQLDPDMLPLLGGHLCSSSSPIPATTVCLMHMRGDPSTMTSPSHTSYASYPGGILEGVATELLARIRDAEAAGIRRWRLILDPGLGFAKTAAGNLELLRRLPELRAWPGLVGLPWLVGPSRKRFVGALTGVAEPRERVFGTAAAVAAAVQGGADLVRVHDTEPMRQVVAVADAIWRH